jgi:histidinol-phosphate aminotransferase
MTDAQRDILALDKNESPIVWERLLDLRLDPEVFRRYPDASALAQAWARELGLSPEQVLPTNGGDEAIELALRELVGEGGSIAVAAPTFSSFEITAAALNQTVLRTSYGDRGVFPVEQMLDLCARERPSAVVLIDPNNPTGTRVPAGFVAKVRDAAAGALIILDRAYADFAGVDDDAEVLAQDANLVIIRSLSKCPGLAGLRVGALIGAPELLQKAARRRQPYTVSSAAVAVGVMALEDRPARARCVEVVEASRRVLVEGLEALGVSVIHGPANFVLAMLGEDARWIVERCRGRGLLLRDFSACPVYRGSVRITVGDAAQTARALEVLGGVMRLRPLVFDMDGTLIDTAASFNECIRQAAASLSGRDVPVALVDEIKADVRFNDDYDATREALVRLGAPADMDAIKRVFDALYRGERGAEGLRRVETARIATETLRGLKARFTLALATGRPREDALWALKHFGWEDMFDSVVTADDGEPAQRKPDPWPLLEALRRLDRPVDASAARYVGDGPADAAASKTAGFRFVPTGDAAAAGDALKNTLEPLGALV